MRRLLCVIAAASLVVSSVGSTLAVEPVQTPPPIVEPTPSVEPAPSIEPAASPSTEPADAATIPSPTVSAPAAGSSAPKPAGGATSADPTGRWIVVLKKGTNAAVAVKDRGRNLGFKADRTFSHALRGFSAKLDRAQVAALRRDPAVALIVPDEKIQAEAQLIPTGIYRMGARTSSIARIDGVDQRVNADVAIVDTGITMVPDLNVVGGYNCSTTNRAAWRDVYGHGTHVAGTVGAIDNGDGVVGVAPGVRQAAPDRRRRDKGLELEAVLHLGGCPDAERVVTPDEGVVQERGLDLALEVFASRGRWRGEGRASP